MKPRDAGVVILAAGRSERMNELKAFLLFEKNTSFIEKIISTYSGWGCKEIIVVTNQEANQRMKQPGIVLSQIVLIVNEHLEFERFYSVKLGLASIRSSFCFVQNVDNPFIDGKILDLIYSQRSNESYVSPVFNKKGGHPVLLNREIMRTILTWPENSANFNLVLGAMKNSKVMMPDDRVLININSPEDYKSFFGHTMM